MKLYEPDWGHEKLPTPILRTNLTRRVLYIDYAPGSMATSSGSDDGLDVAYSVDGPSVCRSTCDSNNNHYFGQIDLRGVGRENYEQYEDALFCHILRDYTLPKNRKRRDKCDLYNIVPMMQQRVQKSRPDNTTLIVGMGIPVPHDSANLYIERSVLINPFSVYSLPRPEFVGMIKLESTSRWVGPTNHDYEVSYHPFALAVFMNQIYCETVMPKPRKVFIPFP